MKPFCWQHCPLQEQDSAPGYCWNSLNHVYKMWNIKTKTPQINTSVSFWALRVKTVSCFYRRRRLPGSLCPLWFSVLEAALSLYPPHRSSSVWPALDQGQAGAAYLFSSWVESLRRSGAMGRWGHQVTFKLHALHRSCSPSNGVHIYD